MSIPVSHLSWPAEPPTYGHVELRQFRAGEVDMARELSRDPYVPKTGTLAANASADQAHEWIQRQQNRLSEGAGFAFAVVDRASKQRVGFVGVWLQELVAGRARVGYGIIPSRRGNSLAADAVRSATTFGWTIPDLHRIELYIEPWNIASVRTAEKAGYAREGLLRSHQDIGGERRDMLLYSALRH